jgi:hypothetical protein
MAAWVNKGGVLVCWNINPPLTVEGTAPLGSKLFGYAAVYSIKLGGPLEIEKPAFLRHLAAHAGSQGLVTISGLDEKAQVLATFAGRPVIWAMPQGKGWVIVARVGQAEFNEVVRDVTYNLSKLDPTKKDALEVDADWDGVYSTLLANGEVMLYNSNSEPRQKTVGGTAILLPPKSLRSVLIRPGN